MDNYEKVRGILNKHLSLQGGDSLGITDGNVYRAVIDAIDEALRIHDVMPRFLKTKYTLEELDQYVMELSARTDKHIHRGKLEDIEKLIRWRRGYDALNGA
jgi:hypothetical protein